MMFVSDLAGIPVTDSSNASDYAHRVENGVSASGYMARPEGAPLARCAIRFPKELYIDVKVRKEMAEEQERKKTRLVDLMMSHKIWLHQGSTNSCHAFAVIHAMMTDIIVRSEKPISLNPTFTANLAGDYRDMGGWGDRDLELIAEYGVPSLEEMPELNIFGNAARLAVERAKPFALKRKVTEWYFFGGDWDAKASMALRRFGCYTGHSKIGHEIMTCGLGRDKNGDEMMLDCDNYGNGYPDLVWRTRRFGAGEDQGCPRVVGVVGVVN